MEVGIETSFLSPEIKCHPMMKVVISDTGIGISEDHQNHIFDKCQQRSVSVARTFGGTGLGLSICKLLIENMGGSIGVNSRLGLGSSFWFTLPAELPNQKDLALQSIEVSTADTGGLHVLVAEDNIVNQKLLTNMLKRMGHTSEVASNGKIAIEMLERGREFDVILMDIQMPVMDGFEATARIRNMGFTALPILGLTASVSRSDFGEFGFNDWLPKPIPMRDLKSRLYRIKSKKRERDTSPLPVVGKGQ